MDAVKKEDMRELVPGLLHIWADPLHSSDVERFIALKGPASALTARGDTRSREGARQRTPYGCYNLQTSDINVEHVLP
jgi:hypothetical protein